MSDFFAPAPEPKTELGRHRILASSAGVRVSPLCLGAMSIGEAWKDFMGSMTKEQSFKLLDAFYDAGGNFVDTANNYQSEQSETWIGEWMTQRKNRDQIVVATKYTTQYRAWEIGKGPQASNYCGNDRKAMHVSVRDSLKKLQTDYIDLLYVHWWDHTTSIKEMMDALHILVEQGKVLYLGISDSPAWIVSAANEYALANGKTPFSVYQGRWNVMLRDFEREIIPMSRHYGMALCPWDVLSQGHLQSKKQIEQRKKDNESLRTTLKNGAIQSEDEIKMSEVLEKIGAKHGTESVTAVALAYCIAKAPHTIPIIGGRKIEHLMDNIEGLKLKLTPEDIEEMEKVVGFDPGFPHDFIGQDPKLTGQTTFLLKASNPMRWQ